MRITTRLGREVDVAPDYTVPQHWERFTDAEHDRWDRLYARQRALLRDRACDAFLRGLDTLELSRGGVPRLDELSERLAHLTGWTVVAVPDLVPDAVFFDHLAHRRFPAGNFLRDEAHFAYLQEPDVFHDVFGHVPLLTDPVFADFMQAYGEGGLRAAGRGVLRNLARLYWYTVEFGLIATEAGLRIYGAGVLSSAAESIHALEDPAPHRLAFDLERVMRAEYRIDTFQDTYWVIDSFEALLRATRQDFGPLYDRLEADPTSYAPDRVLPADRTVAAALAIGS